MSKISCYIYFYIFFNLHFKDNFDYFSLIDFCMFFSGTMLKDDLKYQSMYEINPGKYNIILWN